MNIPLSQSIEDKEYRLKYVIKLALVINKFVLINVYRVFFLSFAGNLYITAFQQSDFQNGRSYVCMAINNFVRQTTSAPGIVLQPAESFSTYLYVSSGYYKKLWFY